MYHVVKKDFVPFDVSTGNLFSLTNRTLCAEYGYHVKHLTNISCFTLPENYKCGFYFSRNNILKEYIFARSRWDRKLKKKCYYFNVFLHVSPLLG